MQIANQKVFLLLFRMILSFLPQSVINIWPDLCILIKSSESPATRLTHLEAVPVSGDAAHAEAVAARCGRRVPEHIQTDGTLELLVRQEAAAERHPVEGSETGGWIRSVPAPLLSYQLHRKKSCVSLWLVVVLIVKVIPACLLSCTLESVIPTYHIY